MRKFYQDKDFSFIVFVMVLFFLPISINISSLLLGAAIVLKLLQVFILKQPLFVSKVLLYSSIIGLVFFVYIILASVVEVGFSNTFLNFGKQFSRWELFFLTPMLLKSKKENEALVYSFFVGTVISIIYVGALAYLYDMKFGSASFQQITDIHHTYLSLFLLFFANFLFIKHAQYRKRDQSISVYCGVCIILSFFVIYFLESKISIVIFCFLAFYHSIAYFSKKNAPAFVIFGLALATAFFFFNKKLQVSYEHAMDFRLEIWQESVKTFNDNFFFGSQRFSEKDLLNYGHYVSGKHYFMDCDLNSHNQYLSLAMKYGILGLSFIIIYGFLMYKCINPTTSIADVKELFGFVIIVLAIFYIENVLDRHHGIVFCSIFYNYYLLKIENGKN